MRRAAALVVVAILCLLDPAQSPPPPFPPMEMRWISGDPTPDSADRFAVVAGVAAHPGARYGLGMCAFNRTVYVHGGFRFDTTIGTMYQSDLVIR